VAIWSVRWNALRRVRLWVAVLVSASAGAVVICTFTLPGTSIPAAFVWTAFGLTFPVVGSVLVPGVVGMRGDSRSRDFAGGGEQARIYWRRARERVPLPVAAVIAAILVLGWLAGIPAFFQLSGGLPERHGDHYVRDDHGVVTTLTRAEAEHQLAAWYRGFAAEAMAMCALAAGAILADPLRPDDAESRP
jgi:hypothetical protein